MGIGQPPSGHRPQGGSTSAPANRGKLERADHLYIAGDITWKEYSRIKNEAESALVSIHVPEFDEAVEAGRLLSEFGALWESASVEQRNRMLKSTLQAIYVDIGKREIIGLLPKKTFLGPILATAEQEDISRLSILRRMF